MDYQLDAFRACSSSFEKPQLTFHQDLSISKEEEKKYAFPHQLPMSISIRYVCKIRHTHCAKDKTFTVWKETRQLTQTHIFIYLFLNVQKGSALQNAPGEYLFQVYATSYVARWYSKGSFKMRYPCLLSRILPLSLWTNKQQR
uniref:Uncharacterized protein n=1 Tax=Pipistrellus kuhlii TaxID=59472 RepID=A0A7J7W355_PIPKU|nr:hypothetical protein mPipKuh1_008208 [Pipistrellus kuhlii]